MTVCRSDLCRTRASKCPLVCHDQTLRRQEHILHLQLERRNRRRAVKRHHKLLQDLLTRHQDIWNDAVVREMSCYKQALQTPGWGIIGLARQIERGRNAFLLTSPLEYPDALCAYQRVSLQRQVRGRYNVELEKMFSRTREEAAASSGFDARLSPHSFSRYLESTWIWSNLPQPSSDPNRLYYIEEEIRRDVMPLILGEIQEKLHRKIRKQFSPSWRRQSG